jgi:hypothetical protein
LPGKSLQLGYRSTLPGVSGQTRKILWDFQPMERAVGGMPAFSPAI